MTTAKLRWYAIAFGIAVIALYVFTKMLPAIFMITCVVAIFVSAIYISIAWMRYRLKRLG